MNIKKLSLLALTSFISSNAFAFNDEFISGNDPKSPVIYGYQVGEKIDAVLNNSFIDKTTSTKYSIDDEYSVALAYNVAQMCLYRYKLFNGFDRTSVMNDIYDEYYVNYLKPNPLVTNLLTAYKVRNSLLSKNNETLTIYLDDKGVIQAMRSDGHTYKNDGITVNVLRNVVLDRFGDADKEWRTENGSRILSYSDNYKPLPASDVSGYFDRGNFLFGQPTKAKQYNIDGIKTEYVSNFFAVKGDSMFNSDIDSKTVSLSIFVMNNPSLIQDQMLEKYDECYDMLGKIEKAQEKRAEDKAKSISL